MGLFFQYPKWSPNTLFFPILEVIYNQELGRETKKRKGPSGMNLENYMNPYSSDVPVKRLTFTSLRWNKNRATNYQTKTNSGLEESLVSRHSSYQCSKFLGVIPRVYIHLYLPFVLPESFYITSQRNHCRVNSFDRE